MARDATARLYDVDANTIAFDKKDGVIAFQAKKGRLVDLDRLHESIWATRFGDGTGMILKRLDVTVVGEVVLQEKKVTLKVPGTNYTLVLDDESLDQGTLERLREAVRKGNTLLHVTGRVDGFSGNLNKLSKQLPPRPYRIMVTNFEPSRGRVGE